MSKYVETSELFDETLNELENQIDGNTTRDITRNLKTIMNNLKKDGNKLHKEVDNMLKDYDEHIDQLNALKEDMEDFYKKHIE